MNYSAIHWIKQETTIRNMTCYTVVDTVVK